MAAYRHVTCRLTAKDRDQLRNRVWATFTFTATYFDFIFFVQLLTYFGLQCFDAVGWAAGRASGL